MDIPNFPARTGDLPAVAAPGRDRRGPRTTTARVSIASRCDDRHFVAASTDGAGPGTASLRVGPRRSPSAAVPARRAGLDALGRLVPPARDEPHIASFAGADAEARATPTVRVRQ